MSEIAYILDGSGLSGVQPAATLPEVFDRKLLGEALRQLRSRAGLSQAETARRAGLSQSVLNRAETGSSYLSLESLEAVLRALDVDLRDLGHHVDVVAGRAPKPSTGSPRPEWVSVIRDSGFEVSMFRGLAFAGYSGGSEDIDRVEADLVASAEQVARERALAGARFRRDYETEVALEVAEGPAAVLPTPPPRKGKT